MVVCYGEDEARSLFGLTNNVVVFGGGKDIHFHKEVSDLLGTTRVGRQSYTDGPGRTGTSRSTENTPVLRPEQIRLIPETPSSRRRRERPTADREAPALPGRQRQALSERQRTARDQVGHAREDLVDVHQLTAAAISYAQQHRLGPRSTAPDSTSAPDTANATQDTKEWSW